jgi:hypothetical protein
VGCVGVLHFFVDGCFVFGFYFVLLILADCVGVVLFKET